MATNSLFLGKKRSPLPPIMKSTNEMNMGRALRWTDNGRGSHSLLLKRTAPSPWLAGLGTGFCRKSCSPRAAQPKAASLQVCTATSSEDTDKEHALRRSSIRGYTLSSLTYTHRSRWQDMVLHNTNENFALRPHEHARCSLEERAGSAQPCQAKRKIQQGLCWSERSNSQGKIGGQQGSLITFWELDLTLLWCPIDWVMALRRPADGQDSASENLQGKAPGWCGLSKNARSPSAPRGCCTLSLCLMPPEAAATSWELHSRKDAQARFAPATARVHGGGVSSLGVGNRAVQTKLHLPLPSSQPPKAEKPARSASPPPCFHASLPHFWDSLPTRSPFEPHLFLPRR